MGERLTASEIDRFRLNATGSTWFEATIRRLCDEAEAFGAGLDDARERVVELRAERDSARELLARLEKELPALSRNVMADCVAEVSAMKVAAERRGWVACREAILAYFRIAWTDVTSGSELEDGIRTIEPPEATAPRPAKDFDTAVDEVRDAFKAVQEGKVERASEPTKKELASWLRNWACVGCGAGYPTLLDNRVVCGKCNKVTSDAPAKDTP